MIFKPPATRVPLLTHAELLDQVPPTPVVSKITQQNVWMYFSQGRDVGSMAEGWCMAGVCSGARLAWLGSESEHGRSDAGRMQPACALAP